MTIRIIGTTKGDAHKVEEPKSKIRWYIIALAALLCIIAGVLLLTKLSEKIISEEDMEVVFDLVPLTAEAQQHKTQDHLLPRYFLSYENNLSDNIGSPQLKPAKLPLHQKMNQVPGLYHYLLG